MDPTPKSVLGLERATSSSPMGRHRCHSLGLALLLSRMVTNRFLQHGSCTDKRRQKDCSRGCAANDTMDDFRQESQNRERRRRTL